MKPTDSNDWTLQIDRLVEGELAAESVPKLIACCEQHPEQWRNIALAFVEQQAWRGAVKAITRDYGETPAQRGKQALLAINAKSVDPGALDRTSMKRSTAVTLALSLAGLFVLGLLLGVQTGTDRQAVIAAPLPAESTDPHPLSPSDAQRLDYDAQVAMVALNESDVGPITVRGSIEIGELSDVAQRVPIITGAGLDESWLRHRPSVLTERELRHWAQRGWRVDQERKLMSVQLADGQRLVIPIDVLNYRPVGRLIN